LIPADFDADVQFPTCHAPLEFFAASHHNESLCGTYARGDFELECASKAA